MSSTPKSSDSIGVVNDSSAVLEFWKSFDFDKKRDVLDKQCVEMREAKTNSINGRKRLNAITVALRSKSPEEQAIMVTEVLKAYQEEIDQLSRRSKFSESAFYSLYKSIYEAPDPAEVIETLLNINNNRKLYI